MLMPSKHIKPENALIGIGAQILQKLREPKTVSVLFHDVQNYREQQGMSTIHFDWFTLALGFLYSINAVSYNDGVLERIKL